MHIKRSRDEESVDIQGNDFHDLSHISLEKERKTSRYIVVWDFQTTGSLFIESSTTVILASIEDIRVASFTVCSTWDSQWRDSDEAIVVFKGRWLVSFERDSILTVYDIQHTDTYVNYRTNVEIIRFVGVTDSECTQSGSEWDFMICLDHVFVQTFCRIFFSSSERSYVRSMRTERRSAVIYGFRDTCDRNSSYLKRENTRYKYSHFLFKDTTSICTSRILYRSVTFDTRIKGSESCFFSVNPNVIDSVIYTFHHRSLLRGLILVRRACISSFRRTQVNDVDIRWKT